MENLYKKTLEKQLKLLSERSMKSNDNGEIVALTEQMVNLVKILAPELQFQSAYAATYPYVGQLSMSDLESLAEARRLQAERRTEAEKEWCKSHGAKFVQTSKDE